MSPALWYTSVANNTMNFSPSQPFKLHLEFHIHFDFFCIHCVFHTDKKISWICTYRLIPISSPGNKLPDWIQFVSCHQGLSQSLTNIISSVTSDDPTILFPDTLITTNPTASVSHSIYFLAAKYWPFIGCDFSLYRHVVWVHCSSDNPLSFPWASHSDGPESQCSFDPDSSPTA